MQSVVNVAAYSKISYSLFTTTERNIFCIITNAEQNRLQKYRCYHVILKILLCLRIANETLYVCICAHYVSHVGLLSYLLKSTPI